MTSRTAVGIAVGLIAIGGFVAGYFVGDRSDPPRASGVSGSAGTGPDAAISPDSPVQESLDRFLDPTTSETERLGLVDWHGEEIEEAVVGLMDLAGSSGFRIASNVSSAELIGSQYVEADFSVHAEAEAGDIPLGRWLGVFKLNPDGSAVMSELTFCYVAESLGILCE